MKRLNPPRVADVEKLRALSRNTRLASHPQLAGKVREILHSYVAYRRSGGDINSFGGPTPLGLTKTLSDALLNHYENPPSEIAEDIRRIRDELSPDVCPMCGSLGTGTIDHVFPKAGYREFSFFSKNLVPSCSQCNSKRLTPSVPAGSRARCIHPFFDQFCTGRLVRAKFSISHGGDYKEPGFDLEVLPDPGTVEYEIADYHVRYVVLRTQVLPHLQKSWPKFMRHPKWFSRYGGDATNLGEFVSQIEEFLEDTDDKFGTPNNWESMLLAGLQHNVAAHTFLFNLHQEINSGVISPEDI